MKSTDLRKKFLDYFKKKEHVIISPASLIPENDPTVLFTTAGMHPLVPFLMGEKHPAGNRLVNIQPSLRTGDIDEVGDSYHHTFFEMMGSWSLGDYFKKEAIEMSFEFLTSKKWMGIDKENLAVSVFVGDTDAKNDEESKQVWLNTGISAERIKELGKKDNWWGPAGIIGPCGPDTEMFYWIGEKPVPKEFNPEDKRWVEIWNDVFMEYYKDNNGYKPLSQKNVDTGMGFERMLAVLNGLDDNYKTDVFLPIIEKIEELSGKKYEDYIKEFRIIADHIKASVFIIGDKKGVEPSNLGQGYIVRRLIRRAVRYAKILELPEDFYISLIKEIVKIYKDIYSEIKDKKSDIILVVKKEIEKFEKALGQGLKEFEKGTDPFVLYSTYGFPIELTQELAKEKGIEIDIEKFKKEFQEHQKLSRTASTGMFKGGLADEGEKVVKYHTATHLLLAALKKVLGDHISQKGSNINAERSRFDFSHHQKVTEEEIKKVEDLANEKIKDNLSIICDEMSLEEAKKQGATGVFESKYGEKVKVYNVGDFSKEICGGPHVKKTGELGKLKIIKEESSSSGIRRIKFVLLEK
ncbi:MAG: alanine--tRNA ligase [Candidatus Nealsonbacteria bacterium]